MGGNLWHGDWWLRNRFPWQLVVSQDDSPLLWCIYQKLPAAQGAVDTVALTEREIRGMEDGASLSQGEARVIGMFLKVCASVVMLLPD